MPGSSGDHGVVCTWLAVPVLEGCLDDLDRIIRQRLSRASGQRRPGLECGDPQTPLGQRQCRLARAGADLEDSITRLQTARPHQPVEQLGRIVRPPA